MNSNNEDSHLDSNSEDSYHESNHEFFDSDIEDGAPATRYPWEKRILFPQSSLTVRHGRHG